jgi:cytosine/adenosine deaminase-related metal-dependent hydrolase
MNKRLLAAAFLLAAALPARCETIAWINGLWFDGTGFSNDTRYTRDGYFIARRPIKIDRSIELGERFVVPAYGDAHHHGIDSSDGLDDKITVFLEAGIFYVKNPNVIPELLTPEVRSRLNRADSIDVAFSNGGLTSTGGHPAPLHAYLASIGVFPGLKPEDMENRAYYLIDSEADLEAKWPRILAGKPDFIKTFLLFSEMHGERSGSPGALHGLDPEMLKAIVIRAHGAKLRVSTHVDTAADFRAAVDAGVDEINHLPQPDPRFSPDHSAYVIDAATARRAAKQGITVVATAGTTERLSGSGLPADWLPGMRANQAANLRQLREAGVKIAIGSDGISGERRFVTGRDEVRFLAANHMLDPLALLRAWCVDTPKTIFPARKIGELRPGFEANFLVLGADPLADPENLHRISMRVKAGRVLPPMPAIRLGR